VVRWEVRRPTRFADAFFTVTAQEVVAVQLGHNKGPNDPDGKRDKLEEGTARSGKGEGQTWQK
jgi:hypothetical protein